MVRHGGSALVTTGMLGALAGGLIIGVWLTRPEVPADLLDGSALVVAPASARTFDDGRTITLLVATREPQTIASPRAGRVSVIACDPGTPVSSGESILAIDGTGVVALATTIPGWRDLQVGDLGQDAGALNAELRRLGHDAPESDEVTHETLEAYHELARSVGAPAQAGDSISAADILWLPDDEVVVADCPARLGDTLAAGDPVLTLLSASTARISPLPTDAIDGGRILSIGATQVPVDVDGHVASEHLADLLSSEIYISAPVDEQGSRQLTARWSLAEPTTVWVVPPGAVIVDRHSRTCVLSPDDSVVSVRVVGSELGQTFVVPADSVPVPAQVHTAPSTITSCE